MKIKEQGIKAAKASNQRSVSRQALIFIVLIIAVITVVASFWVIKQKDQQLVSIAVFNADVQKGTYVTKDMFTTRDMVASEYMAEAQIEVGGEKRRAILLESDIDYVVKSNVYTNYFMKGNVPIYWESFTNEPTRKNSYLYEMDGEVLKLDVSADVFGDMVVPGDHVNIRCLYTEQSYNIPTIEEYEAMSTLGLANEKTEEKLIMLFSDVAILDMLNSSGESIFDYYYEFIDLPISQQNALLEDGTFKSNTAPSQIILSVTAEEADNYMRVKNKGPQYMLTILPRTSSNVILDALTELTSTNGGITNVKEQASTAEGADKQ